MELQVESWTPSAREWLAHTPEARVLHLFQDVCNLINSQDQILSVISARVDRTAFCVRLQASSEFTNGGGFAGQLDPAASAEIGTNSVRVGRLVIEIREPESWDPVPDWAALQGRGRLDADASAILLATLADESPPGGLSGLAVRPEPRRGDGMRGGDPLTAARPAATLLSAGLHQRNPGDIGQAAAGLAGLGAGLTPSGDDYLVGTLHALWSALPEAEARRLGRSLIKAAVDRTTMLSGAWLKAAFRGEAAEHWHAVLTALAAGDLEGLKSAASILVRVGHSSGADSLAGFLAGRAALERDELPLN